MPPPGAGLTTVTEDTPDAAISASGMAAVSCVVLTNVVVRSWPFHCTSALPAKFVPFTVSVNAASPVVAEEGLRVVMVGSRT